MNSLTWDSACFLTCCYWNVRLIIQISTSCQASNVLWGQSVRLVSYYDAVQSLCWSVYCTQRASKVCLNRWLLTACCSIALLMLFYCIWICCTYFCICVYVFLLIRWSWCWWWWEQWEWYNDADADAVAVVISFSSSISSIHFIKDKLQSVIVWLVANVRCGRFHVTFKSQLENELTIFCITGVPLVGTNLQSFIYCNAFYTVTVFYCFR